MRIYFARSNVSLGRKENAANVYSKPGVHGFLLERLSGRTAHSQPGDLSNVRDTDRIFPDEGETIPNWLDDEMVVDLLTEKKKAKVDPP